MRRLGTLKTKKMKTIVDMTIGRPTTPNNTGKNAPEMAANAGKPATIAGEITPRVRVERKNSREIKENSREIFQNSREIKENSREISQNSREIKENSREISQNSREIKENSREIFQNSREIEKNSREIFLKSREIFSPARANSPRRPRKLEPVQPGQHINYLKTV
jgi:chromosome segregation ATPase